MFQKFMNLKKLPAAPSSIPPQYAEVGQGKDNHNKHTHLGGIKTRDPSHRLVTILKSFWVNILRDILLSGYREFFVLILLLGRSNLVFPP